MTSLQEARTAIADGDGLMSRSVCTFVVILTVAILSDWMSKAGRLRRCLVIASDSGSLSRACSMCFSVLLRRQVIERVCRPLFIEKDDIFADFLFYWFFASDMEIHEKLCFDPTIDGFHCSVVCRCPGTRHRTAHIHRQKIVECL